MESKRTNGSFEGMAEFFDARVASYDEHMRGLEHADRFYGLLPTLIAETVETVRILDLGCGTGLELAEIFQKAPNAIVTGVDLSSGMLLELERKYSDKREQLRLIRGSYLECKFPSGFDYAIAVQTMHHHLPRTKLRLYRKIRRALRKGGIYIEGDYVVSPEESDNLCRKYYSHVGRVRPAKQPLIHFDIPLCTKEQLDLLGEAGFAQPEVLWREGNKAIIYARAR